MAKAQKEKQVEFRIYRLIIVDFKDSLPMMGRPIETDDDIIAILEASVNPVSDVVAEGKTHQYGFSFRDFNLVNIEDSGESRVATMNLARSLLSQKGYVVNDHTITTGTSTPDVPIAVFTHLCFFLERHLVAVAYNSSIMSSEAWRATIQRIFEKAAGRLGYRSNLHLEPVPQESEVLDTFNSFTTLRRIRVYLRRPNPELSLYYADLVRQMDEGDIRAFLQDMRNRDGLSKEPGKLPHAAASLAAAGYKDGPVRMEGMRNGREDKVSTGKTACQITVVEEVLRAFVESNETLARGEELRKSMKVLKGVLDRVIPKPEAIPDVGEPELKRLISEPQADK